jgi:hypothetical protein
MFLRACGKTAVEGVAIDIHAVSEFFFSKDDHEGDDGDAELCRERGRQIGGAVSDNLDGHK